MDNPILQRLSDLTLAGDGHAFDARSGRSFHLNATGQVVVLLLRDGLSDSEVVADLSSRCGQHPSVVEAGVKSFINQLRRYLP